ncbi:MAG TPA: Na+/H+ antiporter NhaC [Thermomicrobiales bacterium]|nr:Na+/H+ antiporter NhaC [Thermomicrobiales bacterium]
MASDTSSTSTSRPPRPPSMLDAVIPVVALIALISLSVYLYGVDSTNGPLQVSIFTAAVVAGLVAHKNGYAYADLGDAAIGGISTAMGAIFILLAVGALIGTWNMAGTIPTIVDYGIRLLDPAWFYLAVALICAITGAVTGSSWTTAGTLGVAFVGMAHIIGVNPEITAGAVISGGYFGDKMSPLSETTILTPSLVGGLTTGQHIRAMAWSTGPAFAISAVLFLIISLNTDVSSSTAEIDEARAVLNDSFNISIINLLPVALLIAFSVKKFPAFLSIFLTALFSGVLAGFTQRDQVIQFANDPDLSTPLAILKGIYGSMATGYVSSTGNEGVDMLFSRGGMSSMLSTVWIILGALAFGAIMEHAGFLNRLVETLLEKATSGGALVASVIGTAIGLNIIAADQYIAIVLPARSFRVEFRRRGYQPQVLSRTVEDSGTVTSVLIPWNSCGAYHTGVLGISTFQYFPYCFLNIINPILSLAYGFTGFRMEKYPPGEVPSDDQVPVLATAGGPAQ